MLHMWECDDRLQSRRGGIHVEETLELTPEMIRELKAVTYSDQSTAQAGSMIEQATRQLITRLARRVVDVERTDPSALQEHRSYSVMLIVEQIADGEWLSTAEVAELFKVSQQQVRRWCEAGKFQTFRTPGGTYRISKRDVLTGLKSGSKRPAHGLNPVEHAGAWAKNRALVEEVRRASECGDDC